MENPALLLRRAERSRRQKKLPAPAILPSAAPQQTALSAGHTSRHGSYTALMRSHDRVSTRHIAPRSGA